MDIIRSDFFRCTLITIRLNTEITAIDGIPKLCFDLIILECLELKLYVHRFGETEKLPYVFQTELF